MKKFRGKRRYFRFMWSEIRAYDLEIIDEDMWFAFKHHHLDFLATGERAENCEENILKAI